MKLVTFFISFHLRSLVVYLRRHTVKYFFLDAFFNLLQFSSCGSDTGLNQNCLASKSVVSVVLVCIIPNSPFGIKLLLFLSYTDKF